MSGKHSRTKGQVGEREARDFFRRWFPDCQRGAAQSRSGGDAPDVTGTDFWVEVKRGAKPNVRAALAQALRDGMHADMPSLVYIRDDFEAPFFVLPEETMKWLLNKIYPAYDLGTT